MSYHQGNTSHANQSLLSASATDGSYLSLPSSQFSQVKPRGANRTIPSGTRRETVYEESHMLAAACCANVVINAKMKKKRFGSILKSRNIKVEMKARGRVNARTGTQRNKTSGLANVTSSARKLSPSLKIGASLYPTPNSLREHHMSIELSTCTRKCICQRTPHQGPFPLGQGHPLLTVVRVNSRLMNIVHAFVAETAEPEEHRRRARCTKHHLRRDTAGHSGNVRPQCR